MIKQNQSNIILILLCTLLILQTHQQPQNTNIQQHQNFPQTTFRNLQKVQVNILQPKTPTPVGKQGNQEQIIFHGDKIVLNGLTPQKIKIEHPTTNLTVSPKNPSKVPSNQTLRPQAPKIYCGSPNKVPITSPGNNSERQKQVSTNYGFSMFVDRKDSMVSAYISSTGSWQPDYINLIGHVVRVGDSVLNLGSQSGLEALVMGKIVGPTGKVFIFEPYTFSNNLVTKNFKHNGMENYTTIYKVGASNQKTTATIQIAYSNTGGSQIVPTSLANPKQFNQNEIVQIDKVDAILPQEVQLDFALLDVEKMETKALLGMKQVIKRSPNLFIMCEWQYARNPRRNKQETTELLNFMLEQGYRFFSYSRGNYYTCGMGSFQEFKKTQQLFEIPFLDVFFIPENHPALQYVR